MPVARKVRLPMCVRSRSQHRCSGSCLTPRARDSLAIWFPRCACGIDGIHLLVAALTAAAGGHRVAMTERRLTGGTCVHFGCTPSKALIRCARAAHEASRGADFGFRLTTPPQVDFAKVMGRVRHIRCMSSAGDAVQVVAGAGIDVYLGQTRFTKTNAVAVDGRRSELALEAKTMTLTLLKPIIIVMMLALSLAAYVSRCTKLGDWRAVALRGSLIFKYIFLLH